MKKSVLVVSAMVGAFALATAAHAIGDDLDRVSDEDAVRGFAKTCLASFPNSHHFAKRMETPEWGFQRIDGSERAGRETWQSKDGLVVYNYKKQKDSDAGTPFCSYTALTNDPADPERVSALVQSALNQYHGVAVKRLSGPGQYGWLWGNESEVGGLGRYSNVYLIYSYSDLDPRQISLSLQVRKER